MCIIRNETKRTNRPVTQSVGVLIREFEIGYVTYVTRDNERVMKPDEG